MISSVPLFKKALVSCVMLFALIWAAKPAYSGLVLQWNMEEGSGTTLSDATGNGNTGTLGGGTGSSAPAWDTAVSKWPGAGSDRSLLFAGGSNAVILDTIASIKDLTDLTIECWIYEATVPTIGDGWWNAFGIENPEWQSYNPGALRVGHGGDTTKIGGVIQGVAVFKGATAYTYGTWHHVAVVMSETSGMKVYMDGTLEVDHPEWNYGPVTYIGSGAPAGGVFFLGWPGLGGQSTGNSWIGNIDELRIWDESRTAAQLQPPTASWNSTTPPPNDAVRWTIYE